ncbi:MAG TPA: PAS domain-containing protein [Xanthobacteraceae bacterium]|nr:PAS domain-containing protein [Xanthobacteraceae bacterium]
MTPHDDEPVNVDRIQATGSIGLVIVVAFVLVSTAVFLLFLGRDQADPYIIAVLAALSVIGVFALFSYASGVIEFAGRAGRNDLTKALADSGSEGVSIVDQSGRVLYANRAYMELTGAENADDVRPVERLFTSDPSVADAIYRLAQAVHAARSHTEEIRVPNAEGAGVRWFRIRSRPLGIKGRHAKLAAWTLADITREREKQESAFQSLQHAIDFLDHAPAGFFSSDAQGRVSYLNTTLASWLGYDIAEIGAEGLKITDLVQGTSAALITNLAPAPGEVKTELLDMDLRRKNGTSLPVRLMHRVAFASDGTPGVSRTLVLSRAKGEDKQDALRAAEVRFARFFHNSPAAIAIVDRAGHILNSNATFARLFGPAADEKGARQTVSSFVPQADRAKLEALLNGVLEGKSAQHEVELPLKGQEGRFVRFFVTPVEQDSGEEGEAAIVHGIDTSEEKKLELSFAQAQKMQAIGEFAGFIAHDFNNVLTTMIGNASLLLVKVRPTDPGFQELNQIRQYGTRAAALVRQLLAFARRETLVPEMLQISDVISDLANGLMRRVVAEKVKIETTYGRDLWPVKADINQLERVLINLAANARDAMPNGGTLKISTTNVTAEESRKFRYDGMPPAEYVMIEVADTGTGIAPEIVSKIFEPFFTTKDKNKGTGLGLAAVYGIVKQSGGFIYVDSEIGKGTAFRMFLPRYVPAEGELAAARDALQTKAANEAKPVNLTGRGTVLLVEDEDGVRRFATHALTMRGFTVLEAADGEEGLEVAKREDGNIDIIVSDVMMPLMDGPTMLKEMRKANLKKTKVIFASGYSEGLAEQLPGEEFSFLPKPFDLVGLVKAVKEELQQN